MKTKRILGALTLTVLFGFPAAGDPPAGKAVPAAEKGVENRVLDLERWLNERFLRRARPLPAGERTKEPRGPRYDPSIVICDPSRSHCPIG